MTTKTIKTILFASLIVAMILPFTGMQSASAMTEDEHRANLVVQLDKTEAEIVECKNPGVLERLNALRDRIIAAIAEIDG